MLTYHFKNQTTIEGKVYRLYGWEGNIAIWQDPSKTQSSQRVFYANPGIPMKANKVTVLRKMICDYLEGGC